MKKQLFLMLVMIGTGCSKSQEIASLAVNSKSIVVAPGPPPFSQKQDYKYMVSAVVKVNGKTKLIDKERYHLVAIRYDINIYSLERNAWGSYWMVNRRPLVEAIKGLNKDEQLPGKEQLDLFFTWMKLPENGELELWLGEVCFTQKFTPEDIAKGIPQSYYRPLVIDVQKIPVVQAASMDELVQAIDRAFPLKTNAPAFPKEKKEK